MRISTNARLSDLRPKIMGELYSSQITYLLRKGKVFHLLWAICDWLEVELRFGEPIAMWIPFARKWFNYGAGNIVDNTPMTLKELHAIIGSGEVCMLGKNCPKHR